MADHVAPREWRMVAFPVSPASTFGGNPAGVVLDPAPAAPEAMVRTAVRLNPLSETAFVWPPRPDEDGDPAGPPAYRLRYFAPGGEVALCGHATAAAYGALALAGRLGEMPARIRSVAPGGRVEGTVERQGEGVVVWLDMPVAERVDAQLGLDALAEALGLPLEVVASRPAAAIEDVGIRIALIPVADIASLDAMRPDFRRLRELSEPLGIVVVYPFVFDADALRVRARSFAPAVEIDEDPATGTAVAALGAYLARERLIPASAELVVRQGETMGRPSELRLRTRHSNGVPTSVRVGGWIIGEPAESETGNPREEG